MKSLAEKIFGSARVYVRASEVLRSATQLDLALSLPSNVLAALSLELYFKSLHILEFGTEFKVNNKHSHHFALIFGGLKEATKMELCDKFDTAKSAMDPNWIPHVERLMGGVIAKDLKSNLVEWQSIFIDLRYTHSFIEKYKDKKVAMQFYPEIVKSVESTILAREPEWASLAPPYAPT